VRASRFDHALAEDMEGFAVALACALRGTPLRIVRGVSNEVGDRAPERWRIPAALAAARERAIEVLSETQAWPRP
jgi:futalosine hydrolase